MPRPGYTYILASKKRGTLYTALRVRLSDVWEHKEELVDGFMKEYHVHRLVYYEAYEDMRDAIKREKQLKKWDRAWKIRLIEKENPNWYDPLMTEMNAPDDGIGDLIIKFFQRHD